MAEISRIAKGIASTKEASAVLALGSLAMGGNSSLKVCVAYESSQGYPVSVKWGTLPLPLVPNSRISLSGFTVGIYSEYQQTPGIKDLIISWDGSVGAKALVAIETAQSRYKDVGTTNSQVASVVPTTGAAGLTTVAKTISLAFLVSVGPSGDSTGIAGDGHTLGQRVGTVGGADISNVTIQETYEILSNVEQCQASLSGVPSRDWLNTIIAFQKQPTAEVPSYEHDDTEVFIEYVTTGNVVMVTQGDLKLLESNFIDRIWELPANKNKLLSGLPADFDDLSNTQLREIFKRLFNNVWVNVSEF